MKTVTGAVQAIDAVISKQLAAIMHDEQFQKLEGSWRGLHYLVNKTETGESLKLRVLNCSKRDLFKDFDKATEFDQSALFKMIYESEFGSPGGAPYGAILLSGSVAQVPQGLLDQLTLGGRLMAIVGQEPVMRATLFTRVAERQWQSVELFDTVAPRLDGFAEPSRFKF
jgi:hypothetical protein